MYILLDYNFNFMLSFNVFIISEKFERLNFGQNFTNKTILMYISKVS